MTFKGLDPDTVGQFADHLDRAASELRDVQIALTARLASVPWEGAGADRFRSDWHGTFRGHIASGVAELHRLRDGVRSEVQQQDRASGTGAGGAGPGASSPGPGGSTAPKTSVTARSDVDLGALDILLWGTGQTLSGLGVASLWMSRVVHGRFAPRDALGRYLPVGGVPWWKGAWRQRQASNWQAKPHASAVRGFWGAAGKWATRAGGAVTFGTTAYNQWQDDASSPHLSGAERAGRAGASGALTAGGSVAGAWAGAQVGAVIGSVGGPVGSVVGGAVGGLVGGFVGSELGGQLGDAVKGAAGRAADAAADTLDDVGDALSFWN